MEARASKGHSFDTSPSLGVGSRPLDCGFSLQRRPEGVGGLSSLCRVTAAGVVHMVAHFP